MKLSLIGFTGDRWRSGTIKIAGEVFHFCCLHVELVALENGKRIILEPEEQQFFERPLQELLKDPWTMDVTFPIELTPEVEAILSRPKFGIGADALHAVAKI